MKISLWKLPKRERKTIKELNLDSLIEKYRHYYRIVEENKIENAWLEIKMQLIQRKIDKLKSK